MLILICTAAINKWNTFLGIRTRSKGYLTSSRLRSTVGSCDSSEQLFIRTEITLLWQQLLNSFDRDNSARVAQRNHQRDKEVPLVSYSDDG